MLSYHIFVLSFVATVSCAYIPEDFQNANINPVRKRIYKTGASRLVVRDTFKRQTLQDELRRNKRQDSSLQQALQNLQNLQQQQSQDQRRPGQNGQFGNNGQLGGLNNGFDSGFTSGNGGFPQESGGFGSNQGQGGFGSSQGQGGFGSNQGQGGLGGNQGGQPWTTVRNPLNVIINENTVPEADCIRRCQSVNNYNPVCGDDNITYTNRQKLQCAQQCGRQVTNIYNGSCVTTTTPA